MRCEQALGSRHGGWHCEGAWPSFACASHASVVRLRTSPAVARVRGGVCVLAAFPRRRACSGRALNLPCRRRLPSVVPQSIRAAGCSGPALSRWRSGGVQSQPRRAGQTCGLCEPTAPCLLRTGSPGARSPAWTLVTYSSPHRAPLACPARKCPRPPGPSTHGQPHLTTQHWRWHVSQRQGSCASTVRELPTQTRRAVQDAARSRLRPVQFQTPGLSSLSCTAAVSSVTVLEGSFNMDGFRSNYIVAKPQLPEGAAAAVPLVLVHGFGSNKAHFASNLEALAASTGSAIYALDLLGHGESAKPQGVSYDSSLWDWQVSLPPLPCLAASHLTPRCAGGDAGALCLVLQASALPAALRGRLAIRQSYVGGDKSVDTEWGAQVETLVKEVIAQKVILVGHSLGLCTPCQLVASCDFALCLSAARSRARPPYPAAQPWCPCARVRSRRVFVRVCVCVCVCVCRSLGSFVTRGSA